MRAWMLLAALALVGCAEPDEDGDGFRADVDCDDEDPAVNPDATEVCNQVDDDCNGQVDEDLLVPLFDDVDGDGWGDPDTETSGCEVASGQAGQGGDCDDAQAAVNPEASEVCNGVDDDCDALVDMEDDSLDSDTLVEQWLDADGDGYGFGEADLACELRSGWVDNDGDCDEDNDASWVGNPEDCSDWVDNDCDDLADCEDSDCLDVCMEVCGDGLDNDDDGYTDCEDDECWGEGDCGWPYDMRLQTELTVWAHGLGEYWVEDFGQPIAGLTFGSLELEAVPRGVGRLSFSCSAFFEAYDYGTAGVAGLSNLSYDTSAEPPLVWAFEPTDAPYFEWDGVGCTLAELPPAYLGSFMRQPYIHRQAEDGTWSLQYEASSIHSTEDPYLDVLYYLSPVAPVEWTEFLGD